MPTFWAAEMGSGTNKIGLQLQNILLFRFGGVITFRKSECLVNICYFI